jgi:pimeloyl-ACP methyl ester carboxylesterase
MAPGYPTSSRKGLMRQDVEFLSEGAELRGWLYSPETPPPWPVIVMAHGYSATRNSMTADNYAEVFYARGMAVLLYDHHGFGDSAGEPRLQVNTWRQARGYMDAVSYVEALDEIKSNRIALWGDSLAGAIALTVAGIDDRVAALAVQVPACGRELPPEDPDGFLYQELKRTILSGDINPSADEVEGPMPVVSDDQVRRPSALTPLTAYRWFIEYGGHFGSKWVNDVTRARPKTTVPWHPGLAAGYITCPTIFIVSPEDEMPGAVPSIARDVFDRIEGPKEWIEIAGGHFGLVYYPSKEFATASSLQAEFLTLHLTK